MTLTSSTPTLWTPTGAEANAANQFVSAPTSAGGAGAVYYGYVPAGGGKGKSHELDNGERVGAPIWFTPQQAKADIGSWSQAQFNDLIAKGIVGGLLKPGDGQIEATAMWDKLVDQAALFGAQGQRISPFDILGTYTSATSSAGAWKKSADGMFETNQLTGERRYIGPKFRTTTATSVNLTDPTTAHAVATSVFQQLLGRDPLPGEMNSYASALQQAEQANPTQITTTNQYDDMGNVVAVTKQDQKGGFSQSAQNFLAAQQIKAKPEYGATQAATTYESAFQNAVFGQAR